MTPIKRMVVHLMQFVDLGDDTYARYAAKRYAKTNPWELVDLPNALDVAIALRHKDRK